MQEKLDDLETRLAFIDDLVQSLNDTVYQQQVEIERLKGQLKHLNDKFKQEKPTVKRVEEESPPPHY